MTVLFLFSGQLIALNAFARARAEGVELLESGSKLCKYYDLLLPAAPYITIVGTFLFVLIFVLSVINKIKDFGNTVKMVQGMGVPCPTVMTILCIIDIVLGSVLYLTCAAAYSSLVDSRRHSCVDGVGCGVLIDLLEAWQV